MHSLSPNRSASEQPGIDANGEGEQHNMFIGMTGNGASRIFCLPDNYEVHDASLNDIKFNLKPTYTREMIAKLDDGALMARSLEGS